MSDQSKQPISGMICEIEDALSAAEGLRKAVIDHRKLGGPKLASKAAEGANANLWRVCSLGRNSLSLLKKGELVSAIVLTRAAYEGAATMYYLNLLMKKAIEGKSAKGFDDRIMQLLFGCKTFDEFPNPININTIFNHAERDFCGITGKYAELCEYAHANYNGTFGMFARIDRENRITYYGEAVKENAFSIEVCEKSLRSALMLAVYSTKSIASQMAAFSELCASEISSK